VKDRPLLFALGCCMIGAALAVGMTSGIVAALHRTARRLIWKVST
jgi:hypothetical protein